MAYRTTAVITTVILICCALYFSALPFFPGNNNGKYHLPKTTVVEPDTTINNDGPLPSTIVDTAKSLFYPLSTTRFAFFREAASDSWTWIKLKTQLLLFKKSKIYPSSAPSLERQASELEEATVGADVAAEKVKEAILKSLDQGTELIENSARSAAKLAGNVMDNTAKKLQKRLSTKSEAEL